MQFSKDNLQTVLPEYKILDETHVFTLNALEQTTKNCIADPRLVVLVRRTDLNVRIFRTMKDASDADCLFFHSDDYFSVSKDVDPVEFRRALRKFVEQGLGSSCMVCHEELADLTVDKELCPQCGNHICYKCLVTLLRMYKPFTSLNEFSQSCPLCQREAAFVGNMQFA